MAMPKECQYCHARLSRDEAGLNKKLFEADAKKGKYSCLPCMAESLECSEEELIEKIKEFKSEGCKLFA